MRSPEDSLEGDDTPPLLPDDDSSSSSSGSHRMSSATDQAFAYRALLREREETISALKNELAMLNVTDADRQMRSKLLELTKANKRLSAALGSKEAALSRLQGLVSVPAASNPNKENSCDYKQRYLQSVNELQSVRSELNTMKSEAGKLRQALLRELGNEDAVKFALSNEAGWRGRAQQIVSLKRQLAAFQKKPSKEATPAPSVVIAASPTPNLEFSQQIEQQADLLEKKETKIKALKCRVNILESELSETRARSKLLTEKTKNDDNLIADLRKYVETQGIEQPPPPRRVWTSETEELEKLREQCQRQKLIIEKLRTN